MIDSDIYLYASAYAAWMGGATEYYEAYSPEKRKAMEELKRTSDLVRSMPFRVVTAAITGGLLWPIWPATALYNMWVHKKTGAG